MTESILIVGIGNMGSALVRGIARSPVRERMSVRLVEQHEERVSDALASFPGATIAQLGDDVIRDDAIVLCVKPQDLDVVATKLAGRIAPETLVISILAGITIEEIAETLAFKGAVVRAMSNIPAMVGCAATAMAANGQCTPRHKQLAESVFRAVGDAHWIREGLLDAVTGLSGSGPAYVYMVIEALTDGGVKMGIPRELAASLATQTVLGSAKLVQATGHHPALLRDQVTTPGGTTICAIHELEAHGLRAMLISAVATATERSAFLRESRLKKP
jgi:pyrroline-5-carboxylate reductase